MQKDKQKRTDYYGDSEPREFGVNFIPHKSGTYIIEINAQIENVSQFSTAIQVLGMAKEDDDVEIHLQSPGGLVDASGAFIHAMQKCMAPIHIIATGGCHSAATHILLQATSFELAENFNSLIHNGASGAGGAINQYIAQAEFEKKFIREQYKMIYQGFLTDEEFEGMMRGDDIWLDAQAWVDRYAKRNEYLKKKVEEFEKAQKKRARKPKKALDEAQ